MIRVMFRQYAQPGDRFGLEAFRSAIGRSIVVTGKVHQSQGTLVEATVSEDGSFVWFTVDLEAGGFTLLDMMP